MKIQETKLMQEQRLYEISTKEGVDYNSLKNLLESVRTKKFRNNNKDNEDKIKEEILKAIK
jgi:hypothetical protein